ncbi:MAG: alpha/beta hydrolase [Hyphomicrobiales bacterium]
MLIAFILILVLICVIAGGLFWLAKITQREAAKIIKAFPPLGEIAKINGHDVHFIDTKGNAQDKATGFAVVFLHGASGNLRDPLHVFKDRLVDDARLIFIDRPGHGWSTRDETMNMPDQQAKQVIGLLNEIGVKQAIFVGHSYSGALIANIALDYPERVAGLLFNSPVSHPWPGGVSWYYHLASHPIIGPLFCNTLTLPIGLRQLECATQKVFWPNNVPAVYANDIGNNMVLTPKRFRANANDIAVLRDFVVKQSKRYGEIAVPTTIITGDKDQIVLPWVHSEGLARDIKDPRTRLIYLKNAGHMPHHDAAELFAEEIRLLVDDVKPAFQTTAAE